MSAKERGQIRFHVRDRDGGERWRALSVSVSPRFPQILQRQLDKAVAHTQRRAKQLGR